MKYKSKILSIDVWDTLIRRKTHPDASKLKSAAHLFIRYNQLLKSGFKSKWEILHQRQAIEKNFAEKDMGFGEYNIHDVLAQLVRTTVHLDCPEEGNSLTSELMEIEFFYELQNTYADPFIKEFLIGFEREKTVFLSDFYFGSTYILTLLKKNNLGDIVSEGFSSCDINANKRNGKAFLHLLNEHELSPSELIHVGDNYESDVLQPRKLNIQAVHYLPPRQHNVRLQIEKRFFNRADAIKDALSSDEENKSNLNEIASSPGFTFGKLCSPLFIGFILYISEISKIHKCEKVYFFTREGEFFLKIWNYFFSKIDLSFVSSECAESNLLEVSRLSTFCASLDDVSLNEFMRIWNQYSTQSLFSFAKSLGFEEADFINFSRIYNIPMREDVQYPWLDKRFHALFEDPEFKALISNKSDNDRRLLDSYLSLKNWDNGPQKITVVDVGWRGTIQDNISVVRPNSEIIGVYIGLQKFLNKQHKNVTKNGYLVDLNKENGDNIFLKNLSVFEMLCNSPNGSVLGYFRDDDTLVKAVRDINACENESFFLFTEAFQTGVLAGVSYYVDLINQDVLTSEDFLIESKEIFSMIQLQSDQALSHAYQGLVHNETFGVGQFVNIDKNISWFSLLGSVFSVGERAKVNDFLLRRNITSLTSQARVQYRFAQLMQTVFRSVNRWIGSFFNR